MREELPAGTVTFLFTDVEGVDAPAARAGRRGLRRGAGGAPAAHPRGLRRTRRRRGEHRLKDVEEPVAIFQLGIESFPPLKTISNTSLPRAASSFVGRERELDEVRSRIRGGDVGYALRSND